MVNSETLLSVVELEVSFTLFISRSTAESCRSPCAALLIRARIASDIAVRDVWAEFCNSATLSLLSSAIISSSSSLVGLKSSVFASISGCFAFVGKTPVRRVPGRERLLTALIRKERMEGSDLLETSVGLSMGGGGGGGGEKRLRCGGKSSTGVTFSGGNGML